MGTLHELAEHYASWGLGVVTMNLLYSSIFENDPLEGSSGNSNAKRFETTLLDCGMFCLLNASEHSHVMNME